MCACDSLSVVLAVPLTRFGHTMGSRSEAPEERTEDIIIMKRPKVEKELATRSDLARQKCLDCQSTEERKSVHFSAWIPSFQ